MIEFGNREAVIVAFGRSAVTRGRKGPLAKIHPVDYGGQVLQGVLEKVPALDPSLIDDVIYGCANLYDHQAYDVSKQIAARAGLPETVCGITVSRFCASGSDAIAIGVAKIRSGMADVIVAGGVESMSLVQQPAPGVRIEFPWLTEHVDKDFYLHVGLCAENNAKAKGMTRKDLDRLAFISHTRAAAAQAAGKFDEEIIPVTVKNEEGEDIIVNKDDGVRSNISIESLAALKPVFDPEGIVTAGTSSQVSDGTSCLVLMAMEKAEALGIRPIARMVGYAPGCASPAYLFPGLRQAMEKVVKQTGIGLKKMDVIEINEAFAPVVIDAVQTLGLDWAKVNPNGSAMALGHPLGATGGVLACKALSELERINGKYAMVAMCAAIGHGGAAIYERY